MALGHLADEGAEHFGELHEGFQPRRFLGGDGGHVDGVGDRARASDSPASARRPAARRFPAPRWSTRRDAASRRHFPCRRAGCSSPARPRRRRCAAPATWPASSASTRSASSISPPRAQLMMRTPFFILAIDSSLMMFLVSSVSGVCSVMKSARASSSSSSTFSTPSSDARLCRQERIVGDHVHLQADAARRDDRADVAAADDAQRLAGHLDAHESVLFPLAGMGRGIGVRDWRASANIIATACSAVVIELPNGVFMTMMPLRRRGRMSTLSTPMPARPTTFSLVAAAISFAVTLVAERIAIPSYRPMMASSFSLSVRHPADSRRRRRDP